MTQNTDSTQDAQYARIERLRQSHPYAAAFAESFPWKVFPLYVGMIIVLAWLAFLTLLFMSEHGGSAESAETIARGTKYMMYLFAGLPAMWGVLGVLEEYTRRRQVE